MSGQRRLSFLQAALLVSFLMHGVGLFGFSIQPQVSAASDDPGEKSYVVQMVPYRERAIARAAAPHAPLPRPASRGPRVAYAPGYLGRIEKPTAVPEPPNQQPRHREEPYVQDVPAPPPPHPDSTPTPQETPSPAASSDPPPRPSPSPLAIATPTPSPTPLASPSPSPSPAGPALVLNPNADFSLQIRYRNDGRLKRKNDGSVEADLGLLSQLADVKPVLAQTARVVLPLREAGKYGLKPGNQIQATVRITVETHKGAIAPLVPPSHIEVDDISVDGKRIEGTTREQLQLFIQDGVSATRWLPASSRGVWLEHCEQTFPVEVIQVSDDTAMSPPTSRAP
jgi:outer membrane biosynthesis protein TonB